MWFGLRSSANGRKGAYSIVIFGGEHGDVPLNEMAGPAIAKLVAGGNRPSIIDLDGLTIGAQQRFVTAFLEELYRLNTQPLHLVLEEIDEFAPQTGAPGTERMLGAVARIFQRGRRKGFRAIAITQRPANVHKRILAQCNALVTLRLVAPQDRKAVADWIRGHADDEVGRQVIDSLPRLGRGEGWVWAPEQDVLKRASFPAIETFDSMRAPEEGESCEPASWAEVDLEAIKAELAEAVEEARANDPQALKAEIARLRKELAGKANGAAVSVDIDAIRRAALDEGRQLGAQESALPNYERGYNDAKQALAASITGLKPVGFPVEPPVKIASLERRERRARLVEQRERKAPMPGSTDGQLPAAAKRLLDEAQRRWPCRFTWGQLAALCGKKARGGSFNTARKQLIEGGHVKEMGGLVVPIQVEERDAPTDDELLEIWKAALPVPADEILGVVAQAGTPISVEEIAERLDRQPRGGSWNTGMAMLRANGLICEEGRGRWTLGSLRAG